jgi:hypothetical protein
MWTILRGAFLNEGQSTALKLNKGPDLEDQGGNGVSRQEHRGEGLQEVQVSDRGSCFEFDKIVWFLAVMCRFKKNNIKIPDSSLPPCIIFGPNKFVLLSFR